MVSVLGAARGEDAIAVGNVVGSNVFNVLFVLGLCALLQPLVVACCPERVQTQAMSIPVALEQLRDETRKFALAPYLLTVSDDARPHAVAVAAIWDGDALAMDVGKRTASNAVVRPQVSLLWPPNAPGGYSLIVDGTATATGADGRLSVTPTRAVLHRPAPAPDAATSGCSADCVPILR